MLETNAFVMRRTDIAGALMDVRHEWEDTAEGDSLIEVQASVGLLLYDISNALGLSKHEMELALGADLILEAQEYIDN